MQDCIEVLEADGQSRCRNRTRSRQDSGSTYVAGTTACYNV